jgi:SAM-dependent methyltransferase
MSSTAKFLYSAIADNGIDPKSARLLDFGCGRGALVNDMQSLGIDSYGCDVVADWSEDVDQNRLKPISREPYRIPFEDGCFDVVVSTSVLEHAANIQEVMHEIRRVLRPGGLSMHIFPSKWYLPAEPHIYVPLANYFWPIGIKPWFDFWALAGVRNEFQKGKSWRDVSLANQRFYRDGICFRTNGFHERLSLEIFGNCRFPMDYFISRSGGRLSRIARWLPFKGLFGWLMKTTRMVFMVQRKPEK